MKYEKDFNKLKRALKKFLKTSNFLSSEAAKKEGDNGVYIVFRRNNPIYVGSTTKKEHKRLKDLSSHFSNHTLHRKLLQKKLGLKKLERSIIATAKNHNIKEEKIKKVDKLVKKEISNFEIKFIKYDCLKDLASKEKKGAKKEKKAIKRFEHFVISVLNPKYND